MKIENLMTHDPETCSPDDSLAVAAIRMWEGDCGALPVVEDGEVVGMITDRDICMALAMRDAAPTAVQVADTGHANRAEVHVCRVQDDLVDALRLMSEQRVRRLPVVNDGKLIGILSLNDAILDAHSKAGAAEHATYRQVTTTMQAIGAHRLMPATA